MKVSYFVVALMGLASGIPLIGLFGFRFNLSSSLPLGIYRVVTEHPARGSVVHVCLPRDEAEFAVRRGYLGPGSCPGNARPLGKRVIAVAGDLVTISQDLIRVNGAVVQNSETVLEDSRGRPLPHYRWGDHQLGRHELWLFSPRRTAYDSRYFGPVGVAQVISVLRPIWPPATLGREGSPEVVK